MIKIALVDDHQLFRKSLGLLIKSFDNTEIVFDTDDGNLLFKFLEHNKVDLVLLDLQMPKMDGYQICSMLKEKYKNVKILIISQLITKEAIHDIMELGANGYFTKNSDPEHLEVAIQSVMEKDYYFDIELSAIIREAILWEKSTSNLKIIDEVDFTKREVEIIKMICKEMSSQEVGDMLFISKRTVDKHRTRIIEKTNSKNFIGVVLYALKRQIITIDNL